MGNNVVTLVHTDELGDIAKDPNYGSRLVNTILDGSEQVMGFNTRVLPWVHADYTQLILAGQNSIRALDVPLWTTSVHADDAEVRILKALAEKLGYSVSPLKGKKK